MMLALASFTGCVGNVLDPGASPGAGRGGVDPGMTGGTPAERAGERPLRRLTRDELTSTLDDLFGREIVGAVETIPAESLELVYDRMGAAQTISTLHVEGYLGIARAAVAEAMIDDALAERLMPGCDVTQLGPRARAATASVVGSALQGPEPSYVACYAGDLWSGEVMCPEVTDPNEVKLRLGSGYVTLSYPAPATGRYRVELSAVAVIWTGEPSHLEVTVDGTPAGNLDLPVLRSRDGRTHSNVAIELDLERGDHAIRFAQGTDAEVYIIGASVTGPIDSAADAQAAARSACAGAFVDSFVPRAWRRAITSEERAAVRAMFDAGIADGFFFDGLRMALELVLQSPDFLYHVEIGTPTDRDGVFRLGDYEMASRLSYLAWGTMPDDELWSAASRGELRTEDQIRAQAERLFSDPRAQATVRKFYEQWLELYRLDSLTKDTALFPEFTNAVRDAMREETRTYLDTMIWQEGATMSELLTADRTFLPPDLASIYGVTAPAATAPIALPAGRAGLLTHPSLLAIHSKPNNHSPVRRGVFVMERILCEELPPPPPDVDFNAVERSTARTTREKFVEHSTNPGCATCHSKIDPIGFAFENFDTLGRYRTEENGAPIDASGGVASLGQEPDALSGAVELAQALAASDVPSRCMTRQWLRFGLARAEGASDGETLDALYDALTTDGIRAMLVRLATTDAFAHRITTEGDAR